MAWISAPQKLKKNYSWGPLGALSTAQSGLYSNRHKRGLDPPIANLKHNTEWNIYPPNPQGTDLGTLAVLSHVCKKVRLQQHLKFDNRTPLHLNSQFFFPQHVCCSIFCRLIFVPLQVKRVPPNKRVSRLHPVRDINEILIISLHYNIHWSILHFLSGPTLMWLPIHTLNWFNVLFVQLKKMFLSTLI